jgi:hypothetical protein
LNGDSFADLREFSVVKGKAYVRVLAHFYGMIAGGGKLQATSGDVGYLHVPHAGRRGLHGVNARELGGFSVFTVKFCCLGIGAGEGRFLAVVFAEVEMDGKAVAAGATGLDDVLD